jgi:hypothetical protein
MTQRRRGAGRIAAWIWWWWEMPYLRSTLRSLKVGPSLVLARKTKREVPFDQLRAGYSLRCASFRMTAFF